VFSDHNGVVCSLNFFKIPLGPKESGGFKSGLASASDDGTVKIYFEEDFGLFLLRFNSLYEYS